MDGIRDNSVRMAEELSRRSVQADLRLQRTGRPRQAFLDWLTALLDLRARDSQTAVLLQYSPFCFARWGFAPYLPLWIFLVKVGRNRPVVAVMVHEPYVEMDSWRWTLMGLWQRLQLWLVRVAADVSFASIDPWARSLGAQFPKRRVHHLPVGSNFPDRRESRMQERERMGVDDETLLVASLGRDHPGWLRQYVEDAVNAIAATGRRLVLLSLGAEVPPLTSMAPSITVWAPGYLDAEQLAGKLAASDLFLAPLVDGVSTRRSSVMAALQHALPVVGTDGPLTDSLLREAGSAVVLVPVGDSSAFADCAARLAINEAARDSTAHAARQLYEDKFDWDVVCQRFLMGIPSD